MNSKKDIYKVYMIVSCLVSGVYAKNISEFGNFSTDDIAKTHQIHTAQNPQNKQKNSYNDTLAFVYMLDDFSVDNPSSDTNSTNLANLANDASDNSSAPPIKKYPSIEPSEPLEAESKPESKTHIKLDSSSDSNKNLATDSQINPQIDSRRLQNPPQNLGQNLAQTHTTKAHSKIYQPISITKTTYASFSIGYSYNQILTDKISLQNAKSSYKKSAHGALFGLERGSMVKNFMFGGYLYGVAGDDYSLGFGMRASYVLWRYVIPSVGLGYGLQHIQFPQDSAQYNIHGLHYDMGLFVNVYRGFGLKFEAKALYPMGILRGVDASKYGNPIFLGYSLIVSFAFYDFSI